MTTFYFKYKNKMSLNLNQSNVKRKKLLKYLPNRYDNNYQTYSILPLLWSIPF